MQQECEKRNAYRILVGKQGGKKPQGRATYGWEVNTEIDFRVTGSTEWGSMDWSDLAQDRVPWRDLVNAVMNLRGCIKFWKIV
jgi:hypothetical protein